MKNVSNASFFLLLVYHPVLGKLLLAAVFAVAYRVLAPNMSYIQNLQNSIVIVCSSFMVLTYLCKALHNLSHSHFQLIAPWLNCKASSSLLSRHN